MTAHLTVEDWGALVAAGEVEGLHAAIALFQAHKATVRPERHMELAERVTNALAKQTELAAAVRRRFWDDAVALVRRGCKAKAPARRILMAVCRLARERSGGGMPLGYGVFREDELKQLVRDEIAAWVAEQKKARSA